LLTNHNFIFRINTEFNLENAQGLHLYLSHVISRSCISMTLFHAVASQ